MLLQVMMLNDDCDRVRVTDLFERYYRSMYHTAFSILKDAAQAEDAVSAAYIKVIENKGKADIPEPAKARVYMNIIVRNIAIDMERLRKRERNICLTDEMEEVLPSTISSFESGIETQELVHMMVEGIRQLPVKYRDILHLKVFYEYTDEKICVILNITKGNLRTRLCRARAYLYTYLKEHGGVK